MSRVRPLRLAIPAVLIALAVPATGAAAKTFKPNKLNDHAPNGCTKKDCTLREAVNKANSTPAKDKIKLRGGKTYKLKIEGGDEDMNATGDIDILEPLKISSKGGRATVNGKHVDRVFHIPLAGSSAKFVNLQIKGGEPADMNPAASGGGIAADGTGKVSVIKSLVTHNEGLFSGGGINVGGTASLKVSKSTISQNTSGRGGGIHGDASMKIVGSTIAHNASSGTGGGIKASQDLTLRNSTVYGNRAANDGGGISALATTTLNSVTIVKNTTGGAGGGIDSSGTTTVSNSLIALNKLTGMSASGIDCAGAFMSGGHNLRGTDEMGCTGFTGTGDIVRAHPKLGKLARNGGPTKTVALKRGSPAIGRRPATTPSPATSAAASATTTRTSAPSSARR